MIANPAVGRIPVGHFVTQFGPHLTENGKPETGSTPPSAPTSFTTAGQFAIAPTGSIPQDPAVDLRSKIVGLEDLMAWRTGLRAAGRRLAVTNGCFDLLHAGHVTYLEQARNYADLLLVGLNGDSSVHQLKGPGRPVNEQGDRALVLAALASVDAVCIFPEKSAAAFLALAQPDVYVKGGDYTLDTLNQEERQNVERAGGQIVIIPFVPGKSTTSLLEKIARL
jgi:rfaE bifunctional protein nucleotidyltransferase chain/domain